MKTYRVNNIKRSITIGIFHDSIKLYLVNLSEKVRTIDSIINLFCYTIKREF